MSALCITVLLLACAVVVFSESVEPEYLDSLLQSKNYEEFARLMGIENVDLVKPEPASSDANPMFNKGLHSGDIVLSPEAAEQARQGIRFDKYSGNKWPGSPAQVPYTISNQFSSTNVRKIREGVAEWNRLVSCVQWVPRNGQRDYVNFYPGQGCYSYLGKSGKQQPLSLQENGCISQKIILHEMDHAAGFAHEHNRNDRDDYIQMLWHNIPDDWKDQFEKTNPEEIGLQGKYDYYSIMHYPVPAPGSGKPAFEVRQYGIDEERIGNGNTFTSMDLKKLEMQYC